MRAIAVDDEKRMLQRFERLSESIPDLNLMRCFDDPVEALHYVHENPIEIAFLDVEMPKLNGIDLARKLREIRSDVLIVFITASDEYVREFNQIGGDYYIVKPYSKETLDMAMERIRLMAQRQRKQLYIQTFGRFLVLRDGKPLALTGKAKEILALIVTKRGKEISNEEIYSTIWENRKYSNYNMTVYYNALRRLKNALAREGVSDLLISTTRGQLVDTEMFDCDYYDWQDGNPNALMRFDGEFMSEYSWGEYILASMLRRDY